MKKLIRYTVFFIVMIIFGTCSEPYTPELSKYEDILVIDGVITNEAGPYTVKLSRSFPYSDSEGLPEQQATVLIRDDQGNVGSMVETSPGVYSTISPDFRGIIGRYYQLYVITSDQQVWESEYVELKKVPEIENLYAEFGEKAGKNEMLEGFHIYVDTYDPENLTRYYRYDYEEIWEFTVPYPSYYLVENGLLVFRYENVGRCWRTIPCEDILVAISENMESDVIRRFPVYFVSTNSSRLSIRYSILVKQYSLSREAYVYWNLLKETNQELGSIFDKQPSQIRGNVYNINDPEIPVIGFFEATSVDSARIFITRSELPAGTVLKSEFADCKYGYLLIPKNNYLEYANRGYCMAVDGSNEQILFGLGVVSEFRCCDCTLSGSNIRPSFW